jgi:hypothetical protein
MWRHSSICSCCALIAFGLSAAQAEEPVPAGPPLAASAQPSAADAEPGVSIFNDQLRRFKFLLERDVATLETAEEFLIRYQRPENPPIVGAYPDAHTNALVVIGPPEAEQAIRECLAERVVEGLGMDGAMPLAMQLRLLRHERTEHLEVIADLEVQEIAAAAEENGSSKPKQIADRRKLLEAELSIVEQQIRIVRKYIARVEADESQPDPATGRD